MKTTTKTLFLGLILSMGLASVAPLSAMLQDSAYEEMYHNALRDGDVRYARRMIETGLIDVKPKNSILVGYPNAQEEKKDRECDYEGQDDGGEPAVQPIAPLKAMWKGLPSLKDMLANDKVQPCEPRMAPSVFSAALHRDDFKHARAMIDQGRIELSAAMSCLIDQATAPGVLKRGSHAKGVIKLMDLLFERGVSLETRGRLYRGTTAIEAIVQGAHHTIGGHTLSLNKSEKEACYKIYFKLMTKMARSIGIDTFSPTVVGKFNQDTEVLEEVFYRKTRAFKNALSRLEEDYQEFKQKEKEEPTVFVWGTCAIQ